MINKARYALVLLSLLLLSACEYESDKDLLPSQEVFSPSTLFGSENMVFSLEGFDEDEFLFVSYSDGQVTVQKTGATLGGQGAETFVVRIVSRPKGLPLGAYVAVEFKNDKYTYYPFMPINTDGLFGFLLVAPEDSYEKINSKKELFNLINADISTEKFRYYSKVDSEKGINMWNTFKKHHLASKQGKNGQ